MTSPVRIAHCFSSFETLGGVENILRQHFDQDARFGLDSRFILYFEEPGRADPRLHFLQFKDHTSLRACRRRFGQAIRQIGPALTVYHGCWGLPLLIDLDPAQRRVLMLHGVSTDILDGLKRREGWLDRILCVSEPLARRVRSILPAWPEERVTVLPSPISPPLDLRRQRPLAGRPLVVGFCGRLIREDKRVDRLPAFGRALEEAHLDFRMEFLGEGPEQSWLERQFPDRARYIFHGRLVGQSYWETLARWDVMVFVSDSEGLPVALLEALSCGVIPLYPKIGSGGDDYAEAVWPELLYPAEGFTQAVKTLKNISQMTEEDLDGLRDRCRAVASRHTGDAYWAGFARFVGEVLTQPARARKPSPGQLFLMGPCSLKTLEGLGRWRRRFPRRVQNAG